MVLVTDNDHCQKMMADLWKKARGGTGTDSFLQYHGIVFAVHSCVIELTSPILLNEWTKVPGDNLNKSSEKCSDIKQKSSNGKSAELCLNRIPDHSVISADIFERIIRFLYTGEIEIPEDSLDKIEIFAKECEIVRLVEICQVYKEKQTDIELEDEVTILVESHIECNSSLIPLAIAPKTYKCSDCEQVFSNSSSLSEHCVLVRHGIIEDIPPCKDCGAVFYGNAEAKNHICPQYLIGDTAITEDICTYCLLPCDNIQALQDHETQHRCDACNTVFNTVEARYEHICGLYNEKLLYDCTICSKQYTSKQCFVNHHQIHVGDGGLTCKFCDKVFLHYLPMKKHVLSHTDDTNHKHECSVCGKKFRLKIKFYSHCINLNHMIDEVPYKCRFCQSLFSNDRDLNFHERIHSPAKLYQCGECDRTYNSRQGLKLHINSIHLKKLSYKCEECGKQFNQQSHLSDHMRTHTKEKLHMCSICGFALSSKLNLKRHESTHTGHKDLSCDWCSKKFAILHDLKRHVKNQHLESNVIHDERQIASPNFTDINYQMEAS